MGTTVDIAVVDGDGGAFEAALDDVEALLRRFERDYYAWGDGELARLNDALAAGRPFEASPELAALLRRAGDIGTASGGSFEPGIAPIVEAWGFHDATAGAPAEPDPERIATLLDRLVGIADVTVEGRIVMAAGPAKLDLGGIAKGYAVDRILAVLAAHGIDDALVDAGGDLRVLGNGPGRQWRVGVQSPRASGTLGVIELEPGEAAFTSGDYERFFDAANGRMHHLLDPSTGYPATHTQAVTVLAAEGTLADAAATAIFVAGPGRWRAVADALGITAVLRVDGDGTLESTPAMRDRLQISPEYRSDIIGTAP